MKKVVLLKHLPEPFRTVAMVHAGKADTHFDPETATLISSFGWDEFCPFGIKWSKIHEIMLKGQALSPNCRVSSVCPMPDLNPGDHALYLGSKFNNPHGTYGVVIDRIKPNGQLSFEGPEGRMSDEPYFFQRVINLATV